MTARWWVSAEGRVWGPYAQERLAGFVAAGRLEGDSAVGASPDGPFAPASARPELASLFPTIRRPPEPRPILVIADLRETDPAALESALAAHGETLRVRPGLWLLRARESPASLRNALSRRLKPRDALLVVEAPVDAAAWFNLDGPTDRALRRLWTLAVPQTAARSRA